VSSIYAGLGIGTELSGGIRNVRLQNCILSGRQNAIYLKSRDGRGGAIENLFGENLIVQNSPTFIGIDLLKKGIQASDPITGDVEKWTAMRNISFNNITVHNVADLVLGTGVPSDRPVENFTLTNVRGDCVRGIRLANMTNVVLSGIDIMGYTGNKVTITNVTGTGFETTGQ
jgi:polygalacturonase